jgi:hypothetical protein
MTFGHSGARLGPDARAPAVTRTNPTGDFLQFLIGCCLFSAGGFLFANQVMVRSEMSLGRGLWGAGIALPWGTPGMGLLMVPLAIGVCLLFAGHTRRWANLLIWGSLTALVVGVLNSLRMQIMPITLWQLLMNVVMIAAGGGLMFRGLRAYDTSGRDVSSTAMHSNDDVEALRREMEALKQRLAREDSR